MGGLVDGWMDVKVVLKDYSQQSKMNLSQCIQLMDCPIKTPINEKSRQNVPRKYILDLEFSEQDLNDIAITCNI